MDEERGGGVAGVLRIEGAGVNRLIRATYDLSG